jgi:hypothetical protein
MPAGMTVRIALTVAILAFALPAAAEPMLPRCGASLDGQASVGGCVCAYDRGGQLSGRLPGWRWSCDLLRGPGPSDPVQDAGPPPAELPQEGAGGVAY